MSPTALASRANLSANDLTPKSPALEALGRADDARLLAAKFTACHHHLSPVLLAISSLIYDLPSSVPSAISRGTVA